MKDNYLNFSGFLANMENAFNISDDLPILYPYIHTLSISWVCAVCMCLCQCKTVYGLLMAQSMMPLSISNHCEKVHSAN